MFDNFGGDTSGNHIGRNIFSNNSSGCNNSIVADGHSGCHHYVGSDPHAAAYTDGSVAQILAFGRIMVVVEGCEHNTMPYEAIVAYIDAPWSWKWQQELMNTFLPMWVLRPKSV